MPHPLETPPNISYNRNVWTIFVIEQLEYLRGIVENTTCSEMENKMSENDLRKQIEKRRTFAIISHPDAGKTTLTEKFLLYGGAINTAGSVKGKANSKYAVSDWMEIEKERGISVTSSVLQFNYNDYCINILDMVPKAGNSGTLQVLGGNQLLTGFGYVQGDEYVDYYSTGELPPIDLMTQIHQLQVYNDAAESETVDQTASTDASTEDSSGDGDSDSAGDDAAAQPAEDNSMLNFRIKITGIMAGGLEEYNNYSQSLLVNLDDLKSYLTKNFGKGKIPGQPKPNGKPLNEWVYTTIVVEVDQADNVEDVMKSIQDMGFFANSNKELIDSAQKSLQIVELVLGGIGMVAFLVAAIGIANTMMMSTYERTKEIGVMKVLGCDMRDIQKLFLAEAGFIGLIGGIVGLLLSCGVSSLINHFSAGMEGIGGNISVIPWWLALAAVAFSTLMGMVAGYFPARRAMKLSPLAAIHTE